MEIPELSHGLKPGQQYCFKTTAHMRVVCLYLLGISVSATTILRACEYRQTPTRLWRKPAGNYQGEASVFRICLMSKTKKTLRKLGPHSIRFPTVDPDI